MFRVELGVVLSVYEVILEGFVGKAGIFVFLLFIVFYNNWYIRVLGFYGVSLNFKWFG